LHAVGPGHVPAQATFPVRVYWNDPDFGAAIAPNTRYYGAVLIDASPDVASPDLGTTAFIPLRIMRTPGNDDVNDVLEPNTTRERVIEAGESLRHSFVDVSGAGTLSVSTTWVSGSNATLSFAVVRADERAASALPQVDPAPGAVSATTWTISASSPTHFVSVPVTAGRFYIIATNTGSNEAQFNLQTQLDVTAPPAPTGAGSYYNPMRSGHGIFLSQASGQQAVYWYTYLEDATPVWYGVQAAAPVTGSAAWTGPLFRVTWDGAKVNAATVIGEATVTPIDANNAVFSWRMFGLSGSERFTRLSGTACVSLNGASVGLTGQWYAPAQSGYGMDVVTQPDLQFDAFYLYDALGEPRWLAGSAGAFTPTTTLTMNQSSGFCPSCAYVTVDPQAAGTLTATYTNATSGSYSTDITLLPPLSGTWNIDQPTIRLSGSAACSP
jgi:hypothetical protein